MKKIKGFTLLEMIMVIAIIGIISASLAGFKKNAGKNDIGREAVNVIYKEMNQYVKDFQRNKIWEDGSGNEHEITYLYLNFNDDINKTKGENLMIGNLYLYTGYATLPNNETIEYQTGYLDGTTLIGNLKYKAFQVLKGSDNYTFHTRNKSGGPIPGILISNNGKIYTGDFYNIQNNNFTINESDLNLTDGPIYKFLICGGYGKAKPIGIISINAVTKVANLDRCESEKYAGIKCDDETSPTFFAKCD